MSRRTVALLIALFAIAFAFAAMAAIRWPSLMMVAVIAFEPEAVADISGIDWRELGIAYGAPYFLAALCLYAASLCLSQRRRGSVAWYVMGCVAGFPAIFLVDFHAGWWRDPSAGEGAVLGAFGIAILLGVAVWDLRMRKSCPSKPLEEGLDRDRPATPMRRAQRGPVPAAIARQRAAFAAEGRKMLAHRERSSRNR
ncbi:MAG: hypothetical protein AAGF20_10770 [Pseudomonadota bacterium]